MPDKNNENDRPDDEAIDRNNNGLRDDIEPPIPDVSAGSQKLDEKRQLNNSTSPTLSGGDIDAQWDMAESRGDEAVAGSMPTPGQGDVQEIGKALGVPYQDNEELKSGEKVRQRDRERWELDPASSEDWKDRNNRES